MSPIWQTRFLYFAAVCTIVTAASTLLGPANHIAQFYEHPFDLENPIVSFYFHLTWFMVLAWGIGYLLAARYEDARKPILSAGAFGKVGFFVLGLILFLQGHGKPMLVAAGVFDLLFAGGFLYVLRSAEPMRAPKPA